LQGKKNEAVPPQHYLSPNQIKPNYSFANLLSADKGKNALCNSYNKKAIFFKKYFNSKI
jgi:hypothetical protein